MTLKKIAKLSLEVVVPWPHNEFNGDDMASTPVVNPAVHAEMAANLVNKSCNVIVANDDNYALAA